jgi:hypothetical protein
MAVENEGTTAAATAEDADYVRPIAIIEDIFEAARA